MLKLLRMPSRPKMLFRSAASFRFRALLEKKISRKRLDAFWDYFDAGEKHRKQIASGYTRTVSAVSPSVLGTVRYFSSREAAMEYVKKSSQIVSALNSLRPKRFELLPVQVLDVNGTKVLERVYAAPSCSDIIDGRENRYLKGFFDLRKGIPKQEIADATSIAYEELGELEIELGRRGLYFDATSTNILVLDYDRETKKVLFGIVDNRHG